MLTQLDIHTLTHSLTVPVAQHGLEGLGVDSRQGQKMFSKTVRTGSGANPPSYYRDTSVLFSGLNGRDVMLTSHLRQALRLRMGGEKPLLTLNVVMARTGTILLLPFVSYT